MNVIDVLDRLTDRVAKGCPRSDDLRLMYDAGEAIMYLLEELDDADQVLVRLARRLTGMDDQ